MDLKEEEKTFNRIQKMPMGLFTTANTSFQLQGHINGQSLHRHIESVGHMQCQAH